MEKRLGIIAILITNKDSINKINTLLSTYSDLILGRQGIPFHERNVYLISLAIEGLTDRISALTGKIGKIDGVEVKSVLTKLNPPIQ